MSARRLFAILLAIALFTMAVRETFDPDMWWHLRTGELVWEQGLPRHDPFSFTRLGEPWVAHEWLSDAFMWGIYQIGGLPALMVTFAAIAALAYWLIYLSCPGRPYLAGFVTLLAALAAAPFWGTRPQLFNILLMAAFVHIIERFRAGRLGRRALIILPLLTVLWANLHSGYLLGIVLLGVYVVGEAGQRILQPGGLPALDWPDIGRLAGTMAACLLAALLNPQGYQLWLYPFFTLSSPAMQQFIAEWQSPDFHTPHFWFFGGMIALGVLSWSWSLRRPSLTELLLFLGTAAAGLLSARHIPLFTIVVVPIIGRHLLWAFEKSSLYPVLSGETRPARPTVILAALNWLLILVALLGAAGWTGQRIANNEVAMAELYPVAATDYLLTSGLAGSRGFNEYAWGGYLIWRGIPVFVDGRADLYGDTFLFTYVQTYSLKADWSEPLDRYAIDYILIKRSSSLAALLAISQDWQQTYHDDVAAVFVRDG